MAGNGGRQAGPAVESGGDRDPVAAAAADYEAGLDVSFGALFEGESRSRISLPGYPFQRRRHWVEPVQSKNQPKRLD